LGIDRRRFLLAPLATGCWPAWPAAPADADDDGRWLEAIDSPPVLAWVAARNAEALALIAAEPDHARRQADTLAALTSARNIQHVRSRGDFLYNFYRNRQHPHGVWRRTTVAEYAQEQPAWELLLDVDALARAEQRNLVFSSQLVHPESERALIFFSEGGGDQVELREFDLRQRRFVPGGFTAPRARMWMTWFGPDTLLIATDTGPGSLTASAYPRQLRRWTRGTPLADAPVVLEAGVDAMWLRAFANLQQGQPRIALLDRRVRFFAWERFLLHEDGALRPLELPPDANAWLDGPWLAVVLRSPWTVEGETHPAGSLLAIPLAEAHRPGRPVHRLLAGRPRRRLLDAEGVRDGFVVAWADELRPQLAFCQWQGDGFRSQPLPAPAHGMLGVAAHQPHRGNRYWITTQGPVTPQALSLRDASAPAAAPAIVRRQAAFFDAAGLAVSQQHARSTDGTPVPYTLIGPPGPQPRPTLLHVYGGFGSALDLDYQRLAGINWLQHGFRLALAHVRGGGEFGPDWWEAAKGRRRQVGLDDVAAIARDLADAGWTTASQLGLYGASHGGAMATAAMVQRPALFGAVVARVPLTDLLGFTRLLAGPSWTDEYGDPADAADRAALAAWSPLHNLRPRSAVRYPPLLLLGNRNDDRVHPAHARRLLARMRALGHEDCWLFEEAEGGHSGLTDPHIHARREALLYSFLRLKLDGETRSAVGGRPEDGSPVRRLPG